MTRARRRTWAVAATLGVVVAAVGVFLAFAPEFGAARVWGVAALLPARDAMTIGCGVLAIVGLAVALWHPSRPIALPLAIALLVVSGVSAPALLARGARNAAPAPSASQQLRVLEWNTNGDLVSPAAIAALAAREHANVIVLPDAGIAATGSQYRRDFAAVGLPVTVFPAPAADAQAAVLLTDAVAADYRATRYRATGAGPDLSKTVVLSPTTAGLPRIVALHAPKPIGHNTSVWQNTLSWVASQCAGGSVLVAGDFNASVDNFGRPGLGACGDVATQQHAGSVGTWPTALPTLLAMPIDHVLMTKAAGAVQSFTVLTNEDRSGARHRPTLTVIRPR